VSAEAKDIIYKLLIKDKDERMNIKDALDHPWFQQGNQVLSEMRMNAMHQNDDVM